MKKQIAIELNGSTYYVDADEATKNDGPTNSKQANELLADFSIVPIYGLTPDCVRALMRYYKITIRELAAHMGITMKRVREVRENGIRFDLRDPDKAKYFSMDWIEGIEGCGLMKKQATYR